MRQGVSMKDIIIRLWNTYRKIIIYLLCSIATALVESSIGWILLHYFLYSIIAANTTAILIGAVLHYFLTLLLVFKGKNNLSSVAVYFITFVLGIFLQNAVIWVFYDVLLTDVSEVIRFVASKACSLVIPFSIVYYVRKKLYERIGRKEMKDE